MKMATSASSPDRSNSIAILVSTSEYDDRDYTPIPAARNSVLAMRDILVDANLCEWPEDRVVMLQNQRNSGVLASRLREYGEAATDELLFYYVGHGDLTPRGELCLTLSDTSV